MLANAIETEPQRHKKARTALDLLHSASTRLDAAHKAAQAEVAAITAKVKGPPPPKDQANLARQMFIRDELRKMPAERRAEIIADAVKTGDDFLISAVLDGRPWETNLSQTELEIAGTVGRPSAILPTSTVSQEFKRPSATRSVLVNWR